MPTNKVIIVSYTFPPYPGIGGRRWAKFAHQLALKGYEVHVICSENPFKESSQWNNDVRHPNIKIHPLPLRFPKSLLHGTGSILDKVLYRFWKAILSVYSKGVVIERTVFWKSQLLKRAEKLIKKEQIENLIVTIPPYRLAYYCADLKKQFPSLNLIVDYRDPWIDNKSFHGFSNISPERAKQEEQMEQDALESADHVITVSDVMTKNLKERSPFPDKVSTLYNGFDPAEIGEAKPADKTSENYTFVYAGTLYSNLEYIIDPLLLYLEELKKKDSTLSNKLLFDFYGKHNQDIKNKINQVKYAHILAHGYIPLNEIQRKLGSASFGVLMNAPDHSFAFNTKFFEYLANRKPILLFAYPGKTSEFLVKNKLGFHINPDNFNKDMDTFFENIDSVISGFNKDFDISRFSIAALTTELEKYLK